MGAHVAVKHGHAFPAFRLFFLMCKLPTPWALIQTHTSEMEACECRMVFLNSSAGYSV